MAELVTDPEILKQLNGADQPVTDPAILAQLNGTQPEKPLSAGDVLSGAVTNLPGSAYDAGKNILTAIAHPIDTTQALGNVAAGGLEKLTGAQLQPEAPQFDALVSMLKGRYGGMEATKKTIATDPVGFLMDLSTVLGGTGAVAKGLGEAGNISTLAKAGAMVGKVGAAVDPLSLAGSAIKPIIGATKLPERMYGSAAKIGTTLPNKTRLSRIETGLKEGILPTQEGFDKLQSTINDLNNEISNKIVPAARRGDTIDSAQIVRRVDELKPFFEQTIDPQPYLDQLDELKQTFQNYHGQQIPVDVAQKIKQHTYILLDKAYGEMKGAAEEGQKAIARGIKEELAVRYPELSALNARDSKLIDLKESINNAVGRIGNQNMIGLGTPLVGAAAGAVTKNPEVGVLAAIAKAILDDPKMKAQIAIALHRARQHAFKTKLSGLQKGAQAAFQAGRVENTVQP